MSVSDKWSEPRGPDVRQRLEAPVKSRGLFIGERFGKQLALLKEAVGRVSQVAVLWDLDLQYYRRARAPALEEAANRLGIQIKGPFLVRDDRDFEPNFAEMTQQRVDAVLVAAGGIAYGMSERVADLALQYRLPMMAAFSGFARAAGLLSYGPDFIDVYHRACSQDP